MNGMNKILLFLTLVCTSMVVTSCSENAEPRFYVDIERDFDVNASLLGPVVTHFFELKNVPTNLSQNLQLNGLAKENITAINPADAVLTNATGVMDWSLVNTVEIWAISRLDAKKKKQIFYARSRDFNNTNELRLFNTFADLSEVMEGETIDLEVRFTTIVAVPGNFRAKLLFNYAVFDEL
ncbi:MAG: hypothetical protein P1U56_14630 [Saprospiraceae bacterium]|nr:hypothetical protein [Saprospiraceae bacterium]